MRKLAMDYYNKDVEIAELERQAGVIASRLKNAQLVKDKLKDELTKAIGNNNPQYFRVKADLMMTVRNGNITFDTIIEAIT